MTGAAAGIVGSLVQVAVGKLEEMEFLPEREDSNFAPRLMDRLADHAGYELSKPAAWSLGTVFHLGYGAGWGALYALVREHRPIHPLTGGVAMGSFIYLITFPRWGGAVQTGTERPPGRRSFGLELLAASVTLGFGIATAMVYEQVRDRPEVE